MSPRPNAPSWRKGGQTRPRCVAPASRKRPGPAQSALVQARDDDFAWQPGAAATLVALTVVNGVEPPSLEERCARHMARLQTAMTPAELAIVLSMRGPAVTAADVREVLTGHPAFTVSTEERFILGRPASVHALTGATQSAGPASEPLRRSRRRGAHPPYPSESAGELPGGLHLHFHGVSVEDIAAMLARQTQPGPDVNRPGRARGQ